MAKNLLWQPKQDNSADDATICGWNNIFSDPNPSACLLTKFSGWLGGRPGSALGAILQCLELTDATSSALCATPSGSLPRFGFLLRLPSCVTRGHAPDRVGVAGAGAPRPPSLGSWLRVGGPASQLLPTPLPPPAQRVAADEPAWFPECGWLPPHQSAAGKHQRPGIQSAAGRHSPGLMANMAAG